MVEEESAEPVGKVIRQSRAADSEVASPGYITITIAKEQTIVEEPNISTDNLEEGNE